MTPTNLIISFLFLFYGCAENTFTQPPPSTLQFGTDETLDIITWNIENFPKKDNTTVSKVVDIIRKLNVDIIALQEIESNVYFENLINQLDGWGGHKANSAAYDLDLAFLFNSNEITLISEEEIFVDDWHAFPRSPLVFRFSWNSNEIILINNHLNLIYI